MCCQVQGDLRAGRPAINPPMRPGSLLVVPTRGGGGAAFLVAALAEGMARESLVPLVKHVGRRARVLGEAQVMRAREL